MTTAYLVSKEVKAFLRVVDPLGDLSDEVIDLIEKAVLYGKFHEQSAQEIDRHDFKQRCKEESEKLADDVDYLRGKVSRLEEEIERLKG